MRKELLICIAFVLAILFPCKIYAQFGGLLNKAVEKLAGKVVEKSLPEKNEANGSIIDSDSIDDEDIENLLNKNMADREIKFPETGKKVNAAILEYGYNLEKDIETLAAHPNGKKLAAECRKYGLSGSDKEVIAAYLENPQLIAKMSAKAEEESEEDYDISDNLKLSPAMLVKAFVGTFIYTYTPNYTRVELQKEEQPNSIMQMIGSSVVILDMEANVSYSLINTFGVKAAITSPINNETNELGFSDYFLKLYNTPDAKVSKRTDKYSAYNCQVHLIEIPVREGKDKEGKPDHTLHSLHQMLSGDFSPESEKVTYSPDAKIFIEAFFTEDLKNKLPKAITQNMKQAQKTPGVMVAYKIKDERGNEVIYELKKILFDQLVDEGQFIIPTGYEKMTDEQFQEKLKSQFSIGNLLKR